MEHSHKNTDCYFFYYSTCKKGDNCPFRHEPSALGCETMCSYWQQGNCLNEHCNFRHMELKKNRKSIPCYWETQPGGCRKPHCSFMHKNARTITGEPINPVKTDVTSKPLNQEWLNRPEDTKYDGSSTESDQGRGSSEAGSFIGSPAVDPLIVKFEEESDNESVPSPVKPQPRVSYCKTYEEIRLEEIQAESAAYYSYHAAEAAEAAKALRNSQLPEETGQGKSTAEQVNGGSRKVYLQAKDKNEKIIKKLNFEVLTLEEIRRRKKQREEGEEKEPLRVLDKSEDSMKNEDLTADPSKNTDREMTEVKVARGIKRSTADRQRENDFFATDVGDSNKTKEINRCTVKVPPIRLRRSPKRFAASTDDNKHSLQRQQSTPRPERNERQILEEAEISEKKRPDERMMEDPEEWPSEFTSKSYVADRRNEIEIRLCDSSTDELNAKTEEKKTVGTDMTMDDSNATRLSCDALSNVNEDEYLMLDTAADDILKDIDAILTDETSPV